MFDGSRWRFLRCKFILKSNDIIAFRTVTHMQKVYVALATWKTSQKKKTEQSPIKTSSTI